MSFEGTDAKSGAFSTAGQVKKLNSFSLVSLYFVAKEQFGNVVSWEGQNGSAVVCTSSGRNACSNFGTLLLSHTVSVFPACCAAPAEGSVCGQDRGVLGQVWCRSGRHPAGI